MKIVAVTGKIGSGKSTVCRIMSALGAVHLDADRVARDVLQPGTEPFQRVVDRFGDEMLDCSGQIDRKALAKRVFEDEKALEELNRITHPEIVHKTGLELRALARKGTRAALVEAALLGRGETQFWDALVLVTAPREVRLKRLIQSGMSREDALNRMEAQSVRDVRFPKPYYEVNNGDGLERTRQQVERLWRDLGLNDIVEKETWIERG